MADRAHRISIWDAGHRRRAVGGLVSQARSAGPDQEPGDVHRRGRQPHHHVIWVRSSSAVAGNPFFTGQVAFWLWFTVLFANFAEAMAEGRGKAQAATLRKSKAETMATRVRNGSTENSPGERPAIRRRRARRRGRS